MKNKLHQSMYVKVGSSLIPIKTSDTTCPVCLNGKESDEIIFEFDKCSIVKCSTCETMHLFPMPHEQSLIEIYNNNYYNDSEQLHGYYDYASESISIEKTYERRMKVVKKILKNRIHTKSKIHEIGCALGIGLNTISKFFKTKVSGSDISLDAQKECMRKNIEFHLSNTKGVHTISEKKDMVFIFDVIEHLSDIPTFIEFLNDLIEDDGILVITTPNMDDILNRILGSKSPSIKIPQHTIYFNTKTLNSALNNYFELYDYKKDYQYLSLSRILERIFHILNLNFKIIKELSFNVMVPNGMGIYIYKKRAKNA